ncbi:stimulator of interferon genes protein homolog [Athalia rosae]|uniref:stimulator of interferon genes protein homolog n=1 Tax=Athalia rosae TaxID=37344 RepID=UPI002034A26B|nr:stimulator of interferon genes protein homolog [Athalia rosae]
MANDYPMQVVKELKGGGLLYPKNIPNDRGNTGMVLQIIVIFILWTTCIHFASRNRDLVEAVKYSYYCSISNISMIILCSLIWRLSNFFEEIKHMHSRYDDSMFSVFKAVFQFNTVSTIIIVLCISSLIGMAMDVGTPLKYLWSFGPNSYVFSLLASMLIVHMMNIDQSQLDTALKLSQLSGLDYGSGLAYSYFYGYLNIVLPSRGDNSKGLHDNIATYEADNGVTIPVKKLFILIPTSLRIPPDLKEASYGWLESTKSLESVIKARAGTTKRNYHNTVYKIHRGGVEGRHAPVYVVTEGATPLQTFYEVLQHSGRDSTAYADFSREIVGSFYRTLRHIIRSKLECRDLCELVFYDDFDADHKVVNVAEILLDKINEQVSLPN